MSKRADAVAPELRRVLALALVGLAVVGAAPVLVDIYTLNILVRSLLYACVALTVDILWGYTGILTFGQSAFFGIGAYACGLAFTHLGFGPAVALAAFIGGLAVAAATAAATARPPAKARTAVSGLSSRWVKARPQA